MDIFRHLKLEIALAIPAWNDEKYNTANSAGQGLTETLSKCWFNVCPPSTMLAQH